MTLLLHFSIVRRALSGHNLSLAAAHRHALSKPSTTH